MAEEEDIDEEDKDVVIDNERNSIGSKNGMSIGRDKEKEDLKKEMTVIGFNESFRTKYDSNIWFKLFHMSSSKVGAGGKEELVVKVRPAEHIEIDGRKILFRHYALTEEESKLFLKYYNAPVISIHNVYNPNNEHFHWAEDMQITLYHELLDEEGLDHHHLDINKGVISVMLHKDYENSVQKFFELATFPFDYQSLTIDLGIEEGEHFDIAITSIRFKKIALLDNEWLFLEPNVEWDHPFLSRVHIMVKRKPLYYMQNVIFTMLILTLLGLTAYGLKVEDGGSRVSINVTLILTLVAFKFVLASMLPRTAYNTLLDYYMALSTVTLAINCGAVLIPYIVDNSKYGSDDPNSQFYVDNINKDLFYASAGWIGLYTICWMIISAIQVRVAHPDAMKNIVIDYAHLEEDDDKYDIDITYDDSHVGKEHHHDISKIGVLHHRVDEDDEIKLNSETAGLLKSFTSMTSVRGLMTKAIADKSKKNEREISGSNPMQGQVSSTASGVELL